MANAVRRSSPCCCTAAMSMLSRATVFSSAAPSNLPQLGEALEVTPAADFCAATSPQLGGLRGAVSSSWRGRGEAFFCRCFAFALSKEGASLRPPDNPGKELLVPLDYTAVVSFRDEVAYPVMLELSSMGLDIPRDISIVSFDHLRGEIPYLPKLTSIFANGDKVASEGVRLLLERIEKPDLPPQEIILPVTLFDEGTAAPPCTVG